MIGCTRDENMESFIEISEICDSLNLEIIAHMALSAAEAKDEIAPDTPSVSWKTIPKYRNSCERWRKVVHAVLLLNIWGLSMIRCHLKSCEMIV
jgi:hypothetical protein